MLQEDMAGLNYNKNLTEILAKLFTAMWYL